MRWADKKWNDSSLLRYCSVFCWHRGQRRTKHTERVSGSSDALLKLKTKWEQTILNSDAPMLCPGNNIFGWILLLFRAFSAIGTFNSPWISKDRYQSSAVPFYVCFCPVSSFTWSHSHHNTFTCSETTDVIPCYHIDLQSSLTCESLMINNPPRHCWSVEAVQKNESKPEKCLLPVSVFSVVNISHWGILKIILFACFFRWCLDSHDDNDTPTLPFQERRML